MLPAIGSFCRSLSGLFFLVSVRQRASFPSTFNRLFNCSVPSSSNSFRHSGLNSLKGKSSVQLSKHLGQVQVNRNITMSATLMDSQNLEVEKAKLNGKENQSFGEEDESSKLYFVKMSSTASAPMKGSKLAAGYDLRSAYDAVVPARGSALIKTDIQIKLPRGTYGRVAPRSGLAWKNKIDVGAGVIDEDYRGNVGVILFNHSDEDFKVEVGDRIAQLICEKIVYPDIFEIGSLEESERGANGFGSTGTKN